TELGARVHGVGGDVAAVQHDAAGIALHQTHDHVEAGGLAGTVGTEQADDFTGVQGQAELFDDFAFLVAFTQAFGDEHYFFSPAAAFFLGWITVRTRLPSPPLCIAPLRVL